MLFLRRIEQIKLSSERQKFEHGCNLTFDLLKIKRLKASTFLPINKNPDPRRKDFQATYISDYPLCCAL